MLRFPDDDGGYYEMYCAPELDGEPIRKVSASPGGVTIDEAVKITLGNPDDKAFGSLPNLLVSYDLFKSKIAVMEERGNHEAAEAMRRQLEEQIAKQIKNE